MSLGLCGGGRAAWGWVHTDKSVHLWIRLLSIPRVPWGRKIHHSWGPLARSGGALGSSQSRQHRGLRDVTGDSSMTRKPVIYSELPTQGPQSQRTHTSGLLLLLWAAGDGAVGDPKPTGTGQWGTPSPRGQGSEAPRAHRDRAPGGAPRTPSSTRGPAPAVSLPWPLRAGAHVWPQLPMATGRW